MPKKEHISKTLNSPTEIRVLNIHEIEAVSGGGQMLSSAISEVMKNFGGALQTAARGG